MYPYPGVMIAAGAISKGAVVTLKTQLPYASGDNGPFGVATATVASGQDMASNVTGACLLISGWVYMTSTATIAAGQYVVPSTTSSSTKVAPATIGNLSGSPTWSIIVGNFITPFGIAMTGISGSGLFVMRIVV
jgi:hypothetical protein